MSTDDETLAEDVRGLAVSLDAVTKSLGAIHANLDAETKAREEEVTFLAKRARTNRKWIIATVVGLALDLGLSALFGLLINNQGDLNDQITHVQTITSAKVLCPLEVAFYQAVEAQIHADPSLHKLPADQRALTLRFAADSKAAIDLLHCPLK